MLFKVTYLLTGLCDDDQSTFGKVYFVKAENLMNLSEKLGKIDFTAEFVELAEDGGFYDDTTFLKETMVHIENLEAAEQNVSFIE